MTPTSTSHRLATLLASIEMKPCGNILRGGPLSCSKHFFSMGYTVNMRKTEEKKRPGTFENQSAHWSKQTKQNSGHLVFSFSIALPCEEDRFHLIACPPETPKEFRQCFTSIWRPTQGGRV
jgi:hypothetical protein